MPAAEEPELLPELKALLPEALTPVSTPLIHQLPLAPMVGVSPLSPFSPFSPWSPLSPFMPCRAETAIRFCQSLSASYFHWM